MEMPNIIKCDGEKVFIMPIPEHPGYGAGHNGEVYSFYIQGGGFSYLNMPYKLKRLKRCHRWFYKLESPDTSYDAAALIAAAWNVCMDGDIVATKDRSTENLSVDNLVSVSMKEYYLRQNYGAKGEEHAKAILSEAEVLQIRELRGVIGRKECAILFGVSMFSIKRIFAGQTWRHLGPLPTTREVICKTCGKIFFTKYSTPHARFCSIKCKTHWGHRPRHKLICSRCGFEYIAPRTSYLRAIRGLPVCCSIDCRQKLNSNSNL